MKISALFVTLAAVQRCSAHIRGNRRLDFERLAGYQPRTQVTDHAAIDLDQYFMEIELGRNMITKARHVYRQGGHSKSYARMTLLNPSGPKTFRSGTRVLGFSEFNSTVSGKLMDDVNWGNEDVQNVQVKVLYETSDNQDEHVSCTVGGLYTFESADREGCFVGSGNVTFVPEGATEDQGVLLRYAYDVRKDNDNGRTLQKFSTEAHKKMKSPNSPNYYDDFQKFVDYYGMEAYGDMWVLAASYGNSTAFPSGRGNADFSTFVNRLGQAEAMLKGSAYMNVWMYVIREMEDAIDDCESGCVEDCNDDPVHALDEAVAFYVGSLEDEDGSGEGVLLYDLADKRALNFKTASESGNEETGTSFVNLKIMREFSKAQLSLTANDCESARANKRFIVNMMKVPLVQGALRYAYIRDKEKPADVLNQEKAEAEGASFAAAILPYVYACNQDDAQIIYDNLRIGSEADEVDFDAVKQAFERNYQCMGISCSAVGGYYGTGDYLEGAAPCDDSRVGTGTSSSGGGGSNAGVAIGATVGAIVGVLILATAYFRFRSGKKKHVPQLHIGNIAAVSEIS